MIKKLTKLTKTLLVAAGLCVGATSAWAYDTPENYKVGTVYLGTEVNNQVLAETFANCTNNTALTSLSTNWSTNVGGTKGYFWAKIDNTVRTVAYPAADQATLYTCKKYIATHKTIKSYSAIKISDSKAATLYSRDGTNFYSDSDCTKSVTSSDYTIDTGSATSITATIYSDNDGETYYSHYDLQRVFNATDYNVAENGTGYQIPSYVYGKCISVQHRNSDPYYLDYTMPTAISTGKLVFGADFYRIQNASAPLYIQFYDSEENLVFQIYYQNGDNRRSMYYQVGTNTAVAGAGYSEYRVYRGWGIKDMVFDLDAGTVSYTVDNVHWDSGHSPNRRKVTQSAIDFGKGKNIAKVRFTSDAGSSKTNYDMFIDNMYLYTLVSGTATTSDLTFIGSKDYEDGYLASTSSDYVIVPNGKLHLQFKNYASGAYNFNNWIALFTNADKLTNLAFVRSDAWDIVSGSGGITTSDNYWDDFQTDMYGATIAMDITRTDGDVNMVATIATTAFKVLTLTFNKAIGNASEDIVFRLSEEGACLVLDNTKSALVAPPSFTQTGITNTGNPIITVTEKNTLTGSTTASYYTTDDSTPTTSSTAYSSPVTVTGGKTIKAITVATAADGTTTLTSNEGSLTTTEYVAARTYDLSATDAVTIKAEGFTSTTTDVNYGIGSTTRYGIPSALGNEGKIILGGLRISGGTTSGNPNTWYYWMLEQGLWQSGGTRTVSLTSIQDGEVALFTEYDCSYDGSAWSSTIVESYESGCSFSLSKSNNTKTSGNHVHMLKKVQTFVPAGTTIPATVTSAGWATLYTPYALDFSGVTGLEAYTATCDGSTVTLTKVTDVPANTGVVLKGNDDTYSIPVIASSETDKGDLKGSTTEATNYAAGKNYYYLALNKVNEAQFIPLTSGSIAAGKAYLEISTSGTSGARQLTVKFADDVTGISSIENDQTSESDYYNLSGQRVTAPSKGLYIKNGKKVIMK